MRFYRDGLGFGLVADRFVETGERWVAVAPPDGTAMLALVTPKAGSAQYELIGQSGQVVFITEDVDAKFKEWSQRGVEFSHEPQQPEWGGMFTRFQDPDGNSFALVGSDEVSRSIEARRHELLDEKEAERRAAQEIAIAKQVQARLFPQVLPASETLDYAGICIQARQVGGDYYDFLDLGNRRIGLIIGDIAGKGIAAALLMANLQANLRSQSAIAVDQPERLLRSVNQLFFENTGDSAYATLFFADYDDRTRRLRYANCGHLSGLIVHADRTLCRLDSTSTVLGLFEHWNCSLAEQELLPGDTLTLYTDGVTESFNAAGEEFGEDRLIETLKKHCDLAANKLLAAIVDEVQEFSPYQQQDDITLVVAKCR